jgi:hypothetical protein
MGINNVKAFVLYTTYCWSSAVYHLYLASTYFVSLNEQNGSGMTSIWEFFTPWRNFTPLSDPMRLVDHIMLFYLFNMVAGTTAA